MDIPYDEAGNEISILCYRILWLAGKSESDVGGVRRGFTKMCLWTLVGREVMHKH